ncbi:aspartyl protease family protein [Planctomycetota bacterium]
MPAPQFEVATQKTASQVGLAELELLDGWEVLERLWGQMLNIKGMRAQYTVNTVTGPGFPLAGGRQVKYQVNYIRKGKKYHLHETLRVSGSTTVSLPNIDGQRKKTTVRGDTDYIHQKRMIYNGWQFLQFESHSDTVGGGSAILMPGRFYEMYGFDSDLLSKAHLDVGFKPSRFVRRADAVYKNLGREKMKGFDCIKVLLISPGPTGKNFYIYYWISSSGEGYQLIKFLSRIEDDPDLTFSEVNNTYDLAHSHFIPIKTNYERYNIDDEGNRLLDIRLEFVVSKIQLNTEIDDSEFSFSLPKGTDLRYTNFTKADHQAVEEPNYIKVIAEAPVRQVRAILPAEINQEFSIAKDGTPILLPVEYQGLRHWFLLDTGTTGTVYDISFKGQLGPVVKTAMVRTASEPIRVEYFNAPEAFLGVYNLKEYGDAACLDLQMISYLQGKKISGIVGMGFLRHHVVQIDFDNGLLVINPTWPENIVDWGDMININYDRMESPIINGIIDGLEVRFMVDTGDTGSGAVDSKLFDAILKNNTNKTMEILATTASGTIRSRQARMGRLWLGSVEHKDLIFEEGSPARLGLGLWSRHKVTFDFPGQKLYLKKGNQFDKVEEADMSGLHLIRIEGKTVVYSVYAESPAQKAGIQVDDVILKIGDKDVNDWGMWELREVFKSGNEKKIILTIQRGAEIKEISFLLKRKI